MFKFKMIVLGLSSLALIGSVGGCNLGKKNVLFVTKTTLGVDIDTKPMTMDIGFDRKEGTVAPMGSEGDVLPQLASFKTEVGIINQAVGQSFATGNAAVIMSKYLGSPLKPEVTLTELYADITTPVFVKGYKKYENRERYFFVTDTSFAFRVNFGMETGGIPDSVSFGYKRKEIALVPVVGNLPSPSETKDNKVITKMALASLLSTVGLETDTASPDETLKYNQFFATGIAANYLAAHPEIRVATAPLIIPDSEGAIEDLKRDLRENKKNLEKYANVEAITIYVDPNSGGGASRARLGETLDNDVDLAGGGIEGADDAARQLQFLNDHSGTDADGVVIGITLLQRWLLENKAQAQAMKDNIVERQRVPRTP